MEAYRDQYATLFNGGKKVVVLGISVDPDTALYSWARDASFPMLFGSDPGQVVGRMYGSVSGAYDNRSVFVVGPDGKIELRMQPFVELAAQSYEKLGAAVARLAGTAKGGGP
jgi:thioredoxin-dependent peroxiredoxin